MNIHDVRITSRDYCFTIKSPQRVEKNMDKDRFKKLFKSKKGYMTAAVEVFLIVYFVKR